MSPNDRPVIRFKLLRESGFGYGAVVSFLPVTGAPRGFTAWCRALNSVSLVEEPSQHVAQYRLWLRTVPTLAEIRERTSTVISVVSTQLGCTFTTIEDKGIHAASSVRGEDRHLTDMMLSMGREVVLVDSDPLPYQEAPGRQRRRFGPQRIIDAIRDWWQVRRFLRRL